MEMKDMKLCQSCSMPIEDPATRGTQADGSKSEEYCSYCYENGAFKDEMTMEQMVDFCVPVMVEHKAYPDAATAKTAMMEYFPTLKRWAQ